jgi:GNAT superfamily N-acetyltransferase
MRIEQLTDQEPLIRELAQLHFNEWGHHRPDETVEDRISRLRACCGSGAIPAVVVGLLGSELCGSAMLVAQDMESRPNLGPWLAGVYVKPQYRRRGFASALVARIVENAQALSIPRLYLYTDDSESLYASLGWSVLERCPYKGLNVVVMARELSV